MKPWQLVTALAYGVNVLAVSVPGRIDGEMQRRAQAEARAAKAKDENAKEKTHAIPLDSEYRSLFTPAGRNVPGRELSDRERRGGTRGAYERSGDVASGVGHRKARARESVGRRLRSTTRLRAQSAKTDCKLGKGSALDNTKTRFLCDM